MVIKSEEDVGSIESGWLDCRLYHPATAAVDNLVKRANAILLEKGKGYLWMHQSPLFQTSQSKRAGKLLQLNCRVFVGDAVDDEWFLVYLITEIQKDLPLLVAQLEDSDGNFLLIETADFLPEWVEPRNSINRAYLFRGKLSLVPLDVLEPEVSAARAVTWLLENESFASPAVQECLRARLKPCEEWHRSGNPRHKMVCLLPLYAASIVCRLGPEAVTAAILSLTLSDALQLRRVLEFAKFAKGGPSTRLVQVGVELPKLAVAQLASHPGVFPKAFPLAECSTHLKRNPQRVVLGVKLACAFELLLTADRGDSYLYYHRQSIEREFGSNCTENLCAEADFADIINEDSLDWLNVTEEMFEREMHKRASGSVGPPETSNEKVAAKVIQFLSKRSGLNGVKNLGTADQSSSSDEEECMEPEEFADEFLAILNDQPSNEFYETYANVLEEQLQELTVRDLEDELWSDVSEEGDSLYPRDYGDCLNAENGRSLKSIEVNMLKNFSRSISFQEAENSGPASSLLWGANSLLDLKSGSHSNKQE